MKMLYFLLLSVFANANNVRENNVVNFNHIGINANNLTIIKFTYVQIIIDNFNHIEINANIEYISILFGQ